MNPEFARHWTLDPSVIFLNHGSFGACPRAVIAAQQEWRDRMERQPVLFHSRELEGLLDDARAAVAQFIGAAPQDLVFVSNATMGVNAVLRSMELASGDEIIVTSHEYNACVNVAKFVAERSGAHVVTVDLPIPISGDDEVVDAIVGAVTNKTRVALIDHITSPTAIVLPIARITAALKERGVETLVDGAHAPGMVELDVPSIGCAYYTANCHKWICAPKGAGFLWVRKDLQETVRPTSISHGANSVRSDKSRFQIEFGWTGTADPTAVLTIPTALDVMGSLVDGGWPALRARNHELAVQARRVLLDAVGGEALCPEAMLGSMAAVSIADGSADQPASPLYNDPLQVQMYEERKIEVPVIPWPAPPKRLVRASAQLFNSVEDYAALGDALRELE